MLWHYKESRHMKTFPALGEIVRINIQEAKYEYLLASFTNGQDVYVVGTYGGNGIYVNERKNALTRADDTVLIPLAAVLTEEQLAIQGIFK